MTNKLHTSLQTQEIFFSLGQSLGLQPYILSKLAIALSIRQGKLKESDYPVLMFRRQASLKQRFSAATGLRKCWEYGAIHIFCATPKRDW